MSLFDPHNLSDEELKLRQWIYTQRYKGNNGKLPSNKVQLLEDIGMIWNPAEEAWEKGFNLVKTYAKENKNFSPPRKMVVDGVNLNNWITQQRGEYNKGRLSQEKIDKLNDIGMIWKVQSESWDYHFELFKNYVSETGSVLIEDEYETKDGVRLGNWIGQQRKDYKCGRISEDRIHKLETLGMVWDVYELMWQKMFALAKEYYDTYGDSLIPLDYVVGDVRLGLWLKNQRGDYKDGIVPQHRIEKFKEIDMVWNVKSCINTSFPEQTIFYYISRFLPDAIHRYSDLGFEFDVYIPSLKVAIEYDGAAWHKANKRINNDLKKNDFCKKNDIHLYRIREHPLSLFPDCHCYAIKGRDYIGIEDIIFDILNKIIPCPTNRADINIKQDFQIIYSQYKHATTQEWKTGLEAAKAYFDKNGHLNTSSQYIDNNGFGLGQWLTAQRRYYNNNELHPKRVEQLNQLKMIWISRTEYKWMQAYLAAKEHYKKYKNLKIPYNYMVCGINLRNWIDTQKSRLRKQTISENQIQLLKEIGIG